MNKKNNCHSNEWQLFLPFLVLSGFYNFFTRLLHYHDSMERKIFLQWEQKQKEERRKLHAIYICTLQDGAGGKGKITGRRTEDNSRTFGTVSDWASWTGHFFLL